MPDASGPLAGVRVLDLTRFPPGAYTTVLLADLGAEVCRVQAPGGAAPGGSVALSRNKRSVVVDLRHDRAVEVLRTLVGWADVVVEADRPGALEDRGFGYRQASEEFPSVVWCSVSGFGQDGPYARSSGHDLSYVAHSGLLAAVNPELPWHPQAILAIPTGSLLAAVGILAALRDRDRTGKGCQVDISMSEAATWLLSATDAELNGDTAVIPEGPDRHVYECADGSWVAVASAEPRTWAALCRGLGVDDLDDTLFRWEDATAVTERLAAIFRTRSAGEWLDLLIPLGAAIVRANRGAELQSDPHALARGTLRRVGDVVVPRNPVRFRDTSGEQDSVEPAPASAPGADTRIVLAAAGLTELELDELSACGVIS